jgi:hypothetical protein
LSHRLTEESMANPFLSAALVAAAMLVPTIANADIDQYIVVDAATIRKVSYTRDDRELVIVGTSDSGSARTVRYSPYYRSDDGNHLLEYCHRLATLALSKPGKFRFDMEFERASSTQPGGYLLGCTVVRTP